MKRRTCRAPFPALYILLCFAAGCVERETTALHYRVLSDPQVVSLDYGIPFTRLDGSHGSLKLGKGWWTLEGVRGNEETSFSVWALDGSSEICFERPPFPQVDFFAQCSPFQFKGAPPQTIQILINGREVGAASLKSSWQTLRIPLGLTPEDKGLLRATLKFGYAKSPKELGMSDDFRKLTVSFTMIAIVPRPLEDVQAYINSLELNLDDRRLSLPSESGITIPLPSNSTVTLNLGDLSCAGDEDLLSIHLLHPDGKTEKIWRGMASEAAGSSKTFTTSDWIDRVILYYHGNGRPDAGHMMSMELNDPFIEVKNKPARVDMGRSPHVFIYLIDALRADALTVYGSKRATSPFIEAFAKDAVTYTDARTPSSWTLPATVSVLTGVYAYHHRIMKGDVKFSGKSIPSLAGLLGQKGFETLAISQSSVASPDFGIESGFDEFIYSNQLNGFALRSQDIRGFLLNWLVARESMERPVFGYIHTVDPHAPYSPPDPYRRFALETPASISPDQAVPVRFIEAGFMEDAEKVTHLRALYEGEVAYADAQFGLFVEMLRFLNLYDRSIIIVVSDHGEEFGDHKGFDHGRTLYEEVVRIPMIIKFPDSKWCGTRIGDTVSLVDVAPTILEWIGADLRELNLGGQSLVETRDGERTLISMKRRAVFSELDVNPNPMYGPVNYSSMILDDMKCIFNETGKDRFYQDAPKWEIYDLAVDPGEADPLADDDERALKCREAFGKWLSIKKEIQKKFSGSEDQIDVKTHEQLKALGYIK